MNRRIAAILGAGILGLTLAAFAQQQGTPEPSKPHGGQAGEQATPPTTTPPAAPGMPGQAGEMQRTAGMVSPMHGKHLALLNVYLGQAILNAKALNSLVDMDMTIQEKHVKEVHRNIDLSVKQALIHTGNIKKLNDPSFTRVTELDRALRDTQTQLAKLKKAKEADIDAQVDQIGSHLAMAEQIFRDLARTANFTRLEDESLEAVPVKGTEGIETEEPAIPPKHDTDMLPEPARPESPPSQGGEPKYRP